MVWRIHEALMSRRLGGRGTTALPVRARVTGKVGPAGPCGTRLRGEDVWTVDVDLEDWRTGGSSVQPEPLVETYHCHGQFLPRIQHCLEPDRHVSLEIVFQADTRNAAMLLSPSSIRAAGQSIHHCVGG